MLLRTRISLLVGLTFAVICVGLTLASITREDLIKAQYSRSTIVDRSNLWRKINTSLIRRMEEKAWIAADDEDFVRVVQAGDAAEVQRLGAAIATRLRQQGIADRFDVLHADGSLAFSSQSALFQSSIVATRAAREAMRQGVRIRGVGNDQQRNVAVVLGIPLNAPPGTSGAVGMAIYATGVDEAIAEMEQATKSSVLIVNRRGRLLAGSVDVLWESLGKLIDSSAVDTLQAVVADDRVYAALVLPYIADVGSLVARLVSIKDVTELALQQERVGHITIGGVVGFLIFVLVGLGYYMSRSFAPLSDGVGVLNALSRGDLQARIEGAGGQDEVGRIAGAVNVFRANLVAFDRFRRSRERQRRRQERFIRQEMTQLADTLDEEERAAVLAEMDQLEELVRETPDGEGGMTLMADGTNSASTALTRESDSLAMTALAFQKMSDRVQKQNQSLREALAAKNAFIAIQKELDIATRVQLSLLPDTVPVSERFDITGVMRPAKEVGGDFYDFFRLDHEHIGVAVADVSGKGVPAGLFMVMARTFMRATAAQNVLEPGLVLKRTNDFLERNNAEGLFVTLFYGVLDERTGELVYANGGHNPPIVVRDDDVVPLDTTGGVALGMFAGLDYEEARLKMKAGWRVVLFSDGITEAFDETEEAFGDDRLLETTRALPPEESPDEDVQHIVATVDEFVGEAPQFDDITCLVLRYNGDPD